MLEDESPLSVREILYLGDPMLRTECEPVERVDDVIRDLVDDLVETMYAADGIGLAAPQIGVPLRVFVYDVREDGVEPGVLINPRIVESSGRQREVEGCLSIPGLSDVVERKDFVVVEGLDGEGNPSRVEAEGTLSRCLQHECDHLDGVLFIDRLSPLKRRMLLKKWSKLEEAEHRSPA